jgi:hypothetical protein
MNQSLLKSFAPEARNRFRAAMEQRAALLGLSSDKEPVAAQKSGDKIYIGGKAFPAAWEEQRKKLAERIARQGWNAVIDESAYTWFNRFAALRYMEVHGYTPQGIRVLTPAQQGSQPEILERAASINLPGLKKEDILELKLDGQRDEELYRHRYHAGTLSRMRMQYVVPLTGQLRKKIDSLDAQIREAASTAERKRLEKEQATLQKKLSELAKFDEELNHYAQLQIGLDLDDGVRVNYGKFGGLLANVKDVCGKGEE